MIDGTAAIGNCTRCDEPIINVLADGIKVRLSRFSVPQRDASILGKYGRIVFNVWKGPTVLRASAWFPSQGRPDEGRLYSQHFCHIRR